MIVLLNVESYTPYCDAAFQTTLVYMDVELAVWLQQRIEEVAWLATPPNFESISVEIFDYNCCVADLDKLPLSKLDWTDLELPDVMPDGLSSSCGYLIALGDPEVSEAYSRTPCVDGTQTLIIENDCVRWEIVNDEGVVSVTAKLSWHQLAVWAGVLTLDKPVRLYEEYELKKLHPIPVRPISA